MLNKFVELSPQEYVSAAVVLAPHSNLTSEDVCKFVEARVDDYKRLRGGVFFLGSLPRNPQGKIQRNKLREIVEKESFKV
jgi:acyl-coenzyme A synthetase/AMP-(fatty) acid ligase